MNYTSIFEAIRRLRERLEELDSLLLRQEKEDRAKQEEGQKTQSLPWDE